MFTSETLHFRGGIGDAFLCNHLRVSDIVSSKGKCLRRHRQSFHRPAGSSGLVRRLPMPSPIDENRSIDTRTDFEALGIRTRTSDSSFHGNKIFHTLRLLNSYPPRLGFKLPPCRWRAEANQSFVGNPPIMAGFCSACSTPFPPRPVTTHERLTPRVCSRWPRMMGSTKTQVRPGTYHRLVVRLCEPSRWCGTAFVKLLERYVLLCLQHLRVARSRCYAVYVCTVSFSDVYRSYHLITKNATAHTSNRRDIFRPDEPLDSSL